MKRMNDEEFDENFTMVKNHIDDNAAFGGHMYETYGPELEFIRKTYKETPNVVWTIVDNDDSVSYLSGFYIVNRLGYFLTEEEWNEEIIVEED